MRLKKDELEPQIKPHASLIATVVCYIRTREASMRSKVPCSQSRRCLKMVVVERRTQHKRRVEQSITEQITMKQSVSCVTWWNMTSHIRTQRNIVEQFSSCLETVVE